MVGFWNTLSWSLTERITNEILSFIFENKIDIVNPLKLSCIHIANVNPLFVKNVLIRVCKSKDNNLLKDDEVLIDKIKLVKLVSNILLSNKKVLCKSIF